MSRLQNEIYRTNWQSFRVRFSEHFRDYKYVKNNSKSVQHLLENGHSIGPIEDIMEVLYSTIKGKLMDAMERFHIYKETHANNQINDKNTINLTSYLKQ